MKGFGLIGYPLSHSFSERYFNEKFHKEGIKNTSYRLFPIENLDQLPLLIAENRELSGLNITIPYKEKVISFLDSLDDSASKIGAVNTVKIYRKGQSVLLKGFNTDVFGFEESLTPHIKADFTSALILGTGGASKAVEYVLKNRGLKTIFVSRTPRNENQISYKMITPEIIRTSNVIVNTSPVGMYPNADQYPDIPYEFLTPDHVLFDLVYNPENTMFMKLGKQKGAVVLNGLQMLYLQADKAWEIWNSDWM
jgi:shikimate dehydrogenase